MERKKIAYWIIFICMSVIPTFLYLRSVDFNFSLLNDFLLNIAPLILGALAALVGFIKYVNQDIGSIKIRNHENNTAENIQSQIDDLNDKIEKLSERNNPYDKSLEHHADEINDILKDVKNSISNKLIATASDELKAEFSALKEQVNINKHYNDIVIRLENEIDRMNRRGGVNLVLGALIALFGIGFLGYSALTPSVTGDKVDYLLHLAPRVSFVILIELFAYFFLRLYKNGFEEVKYFQNEITNIDSKVLGIKFLKDVRNEELMGEVIKSLMSTERNFILEKGQSTVSLEKEKIKGTEDKNILELAKELLKIKS